MKAQLGISPIAWWNDDLVELSDDVSLEECLAQSAEAGFSGVEQGRRFPTDPDEMLPVLGRHGLTLCGGWFSGQLLEGDLEADKDRIRPMIELFKAVGAPCIVYGETTGTIQGDQSRPLNTKIVLDDDQMRAYGRKVTAFGEWAAGQGMPLTFHHHMGTVVQYEHEVDALMRNTGEGMPLLFDAGHLAMAGGDCLALIDRHHARITHVHTKDIRKDVLAALDFDKDSFLDSVLKGVFTVPGDGDLDFAAIVQRLADHGYEGWFVVEAEQDPKPNPPLKMAKTGAAELRRILTASGYTIDR